MLAPLEQITLSPSNEWPPNYTKIYAWRQRQLLKFRENSQLKRGALEYYRTRPAEWISSWTDTYDPRNATNDALAHPPFVLFKRQVEFVEFLQACLAAEEGGLVEKSRDMGATWICCAFSVWLWRFVPGASVGWGSRKAELVDRIGDADTIFEKMRMIIRGLPTEFLPKGFDIDQHAAHMRIFNPENGSSITGEGGDNIGRGGRKLIYMKDESAHYEHAEMIEAALSGNTRVQIDLSSVHGLGTVFHRKRESGKDWEPGQPAVKGQTNVFVMDWRDHPLKTQAWYDQERRHKEQEGMLHIFAQEVDRNYSASLEGVIIPAEWVAAAIDAHVKLGFKDDGGWTAGLDVADEGGDTNALAKRKGTILKSIEEWGERDTGATTRRAVGACVGLGQVDLQYDSIGIGSGVKAEANRLQAEGLMPKGVFLVPWNAGGEVLQKERHIIHGDRDSPLNGDFYHNLKAQAWWQLRRRFENTWRAINEMGFTWTSDDVISLPSTLPLLRKLQKELSQATVSHSAAKMKLVVDKNPEGAKSPNLADAVVMAFWPVNAARVTISPSVMARAAQPMRATMRF